MEKNILLKDVKLRKVRDWSFKDGIPYLNDLEIEAYALNFLEKYSPISLKKTTPIPIIEILRKLVNEGKLNFNTVELGSNNGNKVLGKTVLAENLILIDKDLFYSNELNFILRRTIAHEIGHWMFHRHEKINFNIGNDEPKGENDFEYRLIDNEVIKVFVKDLDFFKNYKKVLTTPIDFAEHQAKIFAASVLLPQRSLIAAVISKQEQLGIAKNRGYLYINDSYSSIKDFLDMLTYLKSLYDVSKISIEYRLTYLKRIKDTRKKAQYNIANISSFSKYF